VGGAEEVDVGGQVLAEQLEPQPAPALGPFGGAAVEAFLSLDLDAPDLPEQLRRHGATVAWRG
jgi:hypothetical protein